MKNSMGLTDGKTSHWLTWKSAQILKYTNIQIHRRVLIDDKTEWESEAIAQCKVSRLTGGGNPAGGFSIFSGWHFHQSSGLGKPALKEIDFFVKPGGGGLPEFTTHIFFGSLFYATFKNLFFSSSMMAPLSISRKRVKNRVSANQTCCQAETHLQLNDIWMTSKWHLIDIVGLKYFLKDTFLKTLSC